MGRCWGCCQENCGYTNCSCACHGSEKRELEASSVEQPKLKDHPHAGNKQRCPKCDHEMWEHHVGHRGYMCYERRSYDNNDFCGCTHCMPEYLKSKTYKFYAVASNKDLDKAQWYRTYGSNSSRRSAGWVKALEDAKIWLKQSSAKSKATSLGVNAAIVEFVVTEVNVTDMTDHFKKVAGERIKREEKRLKAEHEAAVKCAKEDLDRALARLNSLEGKKK